MGGTRQSIWELCQGLAHLITGSHKPYTTARHQGQLAVPGMGQGMDVRGPGTLASRGRFLAGPRGGAEAEQATGSTEVPGVCLP